MDGGEEPGEQSGFGGQREFEDQSRGERDLGHRLGDDADGDKGERGREWPGLGGSSGAEEVATPDEELFFGESVASAELTDGEAGLLVLVESIMPELGFGVIAS